MKYTLTTITALLLLFGCNKSEPIPSYIHIEPFTVSALGGTAWQKITEGWLYVNGNLIGGFTLPVDVPVLEEGNYEVQVFPGVKVNGLRDSPGLYPFMKRYVKQVDLVAGETVTIQPTTAYEATAKFAWPESESTFDGPSSVILENRDGDNLNTFEVTPEGGMEGKGLLMKVDTAHAIMEVAVEEVALPNTGDRQVWLELHYSNDIPFSLQLLGIKSDGFEESASVYLFNPTTDNGWNKIYINLTDYVVGLKEPGYRLYFRVPLPRDNNGNYTTVSGKVRMDNIRLVHF